MEGLKFDYFVNSEKKTVVCKMTVPDNYMQFEVINIINRNQFDERFLNWGAGETIYKGVSKCHPDDTFDENMGKRIAKLRAMIQFNKEKECFLEEVRNKVAKLLEDVDKAYDYPWHKYHDQEDELCELVDPEQDHHDDTNIVE